MEQLRVTELAAWAAAHPDALLLDIREPWEVALARLDVPGLAWRHIPMGELVQRLEELPQQQPIVVYCHHGMRSLQVVAFLSQRGWDSVYNLAGGTDAWSREVDPLVPRY